MREQTAKAENDSRGKHCTGATVNDGNGTKDRTVRDIVPETTTVGCFSEARCVAVPELECATIGADRLPHLAASPQHPPIITNRIILL